MGDTAKLFMNGRSQAVRLPQDYRMEGTEVYIRKDPATGDIILSQRPKNWQVFLDVLAATGDVPEDFMADRDQGPLLADPFDDWSADDWQHLKSSPSKKTR